MYNWAISGFDEMEKEKKKLYAASALPELQFQHRQGSKDTDAS